MRNGKIVRASVELFVKGGENPTWAMLKEAAIKIMKQTHSTNVRLGIRDGWSKWLY